MVNTMVGSTNWYHWVYDLNPLDAFAFPYLQNLSRNFQRFKFVSAKIAYYPVVNTTVTGRVAAAYYSSVNTPEPQSLTEIMDMDGSGQGPIYGQLTVSGKLDQGKTKKYLQVDPAGAVRSVALRSFLNNSGIQYSDLYCAGRFIMGVDMVSGGYAGAIGQVYIEYSIDMTEPIYNLTKNVLQESSAWYGVTTFAAGANSNLPVFAAVQPAPNGFDSNIAWPESATILDPTIWGSISGVTIWFPKTGLYVVNLVSEINAPIASYPVDGAVVATLGAGASYQSEWIVSPTYAVSRALVESLLPADGKQYTFSYTGYLKITEPNSRIDFNVGFTTTGPGLIYTMASISPAVWPGFQLNSYP